MDPRKRSYHWCGEVEETLFHFSYFCPWVAPAIKAVDKSILGAYGVMCKPSGWLVSTYLPIGKHMR
ncbi:Hypothetical protein FKW44_018501 [Caligus rogercresseyi]|uniref:Uncharacterized protein n=1 Tax=Caligus rogercresseyi TaxID=217165 RepID=A0A7T8GUG6_CALRO|nr:Hypothetical protein FKW44_018501 [Caligus rogercresseyi]